MSCIFNKFSLKKSGVVCSRYGLLVIFLIIRLCNSSRGLSAFAWASPHEEMQHCKREYFKEK